MAGGITKLSDTNGRVCHPDGQFLLEVSKGLVAKHQIINKFGSSSAIGANLTPVAEGNVYQTPSVLTSLEIVSDDNINDIPGGAGALTVSITGIGPGWLEQTVEYPLNGTTVVAINEQFFRVYRMRVTSSGTYATSIAPSHDSIITLRTAGGGATWAKIVSEGDFGIGSTEIGVYTIPKQMTAYLLSTHIDIEGAKVVDVLLFKRENADIVVAPFSAMSAINIKRNINGEHQVGDGYALQKIVGPADIGYLASISSGTAKVEVEFVLLCIED